MCCSTRAMIWPLKEIVVRREGMARRLHSTRRAIVPVHCRWREQEDAFTGTNSQNSSSSTLALRGGRNYQQRDAQATDWSGSKALRWITTQSIWSSKLTKPFDYARQKQGASGIHAFAFTNHTKCFVCVHLYLWCYFCIISDCSNCAISEVTKRDISFTEVNACPFHWKNFVNILLKYNIKKHK